MSATNNINNWSNAVYSILKKDLTIEDRDNLFELFSQSEECESFGYRKLRILALLKCNFPKEAVLEYLLETANLFPYKESLYDNFLSLGNDVSVETVFRSIAPNVQSFIWSQRSFINISRVLNSEISTIISKQGKYVCSKCMTMIPNKTKFRWYGIIKVWLGYKNRSNYLDVLMKWFNKITLPYTVVIDGAKRLNHFSYIFTKVIDIVIAHKYR